MISLFLLSIFTSRQIEIVNHLTAMLTAMSTAKKTDNLTNTLTRNLDLLYYAPSNYHGEQKGLQFNDDEAEVMLDEIENGDRTPDNCDPLFFGLINDILPDWEPLTNVC